MPSITLHIYFHIVPSATFVDLPVSAPIHGITVIVIMVVEAPRLAKQMVSMDLFERDI